MRPRGARRCSMSAPEVDVSKLPNFEAFRQQLGTAPRDKIVAWVDKLEKWCRRAHEKVEEEQGHNNDLYSENERMHQELTKQRDAESMIGTIEQRLEDTQRGIFTWDETADWLRRGNR